MKKYAALVLLTFFNLQILAQYNVIWTNLEGVKSTENKLIKISSGYWNSGASSLQILNNDEGGWVQFTISDEQHDLVAVGFSTLDIDASWKTIEYGISIGNSTFYYLLNGNQTALGNYINGDIFKVERVSGKINIYRNNNMVYTYPQDVTENLIIDASLYNYGTIIEASCSIDGNNIDDPNNTPVCPMIGYNVEWQNISNVEVSESMIFKNSGADDWGIAGAASSTTLDSNLDGWFEFEILESGKNLIVGLTIDDTDFHYNTIKYSIAMGASGTFYAYEDYGNIILRAGSYKVGDVMKIERRDNFIYYYHNGDVFYAISVDSSEELIIDMSIKDTDGGIRNIHSSFGAGGKISLSSNLITNGNWISGDCDPEGVYISHEGNVGVGTDSPDTELTVNGTIHTKEVRVDLNGFPAPDFVFEESYDLSSLEETEKYIQTNKHLPEIPSANDMEENGVNLKELNLKLLQKIEELTLHLIEQNSEIKSLEVRINEIENKSE